MYLIGIAGGSGSGKSTFSEKVKALIDDPAVVHINQDWYYQTTLPPQTYLGDKPNFDHPDAFDWPLMLSQLEQLKSGQGVQCPMYDFKTSSRLPAMQSIRPCQVVLFEGIYALYSPDVRALMDLKVFLEVDADIRFIRRLHRDVRERGRNLDSVIAQYYDSVRPMHRQFLAPTRQYADLLVGEETDIAASVVAARIAAVLAQ